LNNLIEQLQTLSYKVDELSERFALVNAAVRFHPQGERDPIVVSNLTAQGDLIHHIGSRLTALINELSRPINN
jgi:hypothetical protein